MKIVSDSASNVFSLEGANYTTVPMKIIAGDKEYVDNAQLDVPGMVSDLRVHKGKSGSSCPNIGDWLEAFEGEDEIFGLTISKNLSGSYNAAVQAGQEYMEANPGAKVHIFNTLTTGPQMMLLADKLRELIAQGLDFETVKEKAQAYYDHTHIVFCLESLTNLARNGRVNPAVAKIAGMLGIRVVGYAHGGTLAPQHKVRGHKKGMQTMLDMMVARGLYDGAMVRIAHCLAEPQAEDLKALIQAQFPNCRFIIEPTTALCSYYAEEGGLIVGYEGSFNEENNSAAF